MISVQFEGIDKVLEGLTDYEVNQLNRTRLACIEIAHVLEQYAITHHKWTPRTWATNVTTKGTFEEVADYIYDVVLSAGMDYDKYLELAGPEPGGYAQHLAELPQSLGTAFNSGKYAWLWPTVAANTQEIINILVRHLAH